MKNIAEYLFEVGELKKVKRSGWWYAGVKDPESVADHSFRAAIIGYVLASLENADEERTACLCLFHDVPEARMLDLNKIAQRYISTEKEEEEISRDQVKDLPEELSSDLRGFLEEFNGGDSKEGELARDADLLECLLQAKEYKRNGHELAEEWIKNCYDSLESQGGIELAERCMEMEPEEWWEGLKEEIMKEE